MSALDIRLNGAPKTLPGPWALAALIEALGYADKRIAVELNGEIVPKSHYAKTRLAAADQVEIVVAVGGG